MTIFYFIIALGILVLIHEWGHFIVARMAGIRVEQFSIGFGPKLFGFRRKGTEFKISLLPLGGYVKLYGEDPVAEAEGNEEKAKQIASSPDAFSSRPLIARLATVLAGPSMNLLLCLLIMPLVFFIGRKVPAILEEAPIVLGVMADSPAEQAGIQKGDQIISINNQSMEDWSTVLNWILIHPGDTATIAIEREGKIKKLEVSISQSPLTEQTMGYTGIEPQLFWGNDPIVGEVLPESPAAKADLKPQDRIVSINGNKITTWDEMTSLVRQSEGKPLTLEYKRNEEIHQTTLTPTYQDEAKTYVIGIMRYMDPDLFVKKRYSAGEAITRGVNEVSKLFGLTMEVLGRLFSFQLSYKALGGPIQIAQATGVAAKSGVSEFLYFLSFLSLQLGILNLLPIPVLDGGHVLFMTIEGIRGKPLSLKTRNLLVTMGLFLLLSLMVLITINDIDRIWSFRSMWETVRGWF